MGLETDTINLDAIGLDELDDSNGALVLGCAILQVVFDIVSMWSCAESR